MFSYNYQIFMKLVYLNLDILSLYSFLFVLQLKNSKDLFLESVTFKKNPQYCVLKKNHLTSTERKQIFFSNNKIFFID